MVRTTLRNLTPVLFALSLLALVACDDSSSESHDTGLDARDDASGDIGADTTGGDDVDAIQDTDPNAASDADDADASSGPPDTSADRFVDTLCYERNVLNWPVVEGDCHGNRGCTERDVECGSCACILCADEYCIESICDDGGSEECPGNPFEDAGYDAGDAVDAGDAGDAAAGDTGDAGGPSDADTRADANADAGPAVTDPFDPQSCSGTALTEAEALARLGANSSEILDSQTIMERRRTCDSSGCGPWASPTINELTYLTYSGGVTTRYKTLQTDTTLVLFDDGGTPKLSVRHDTHLGHYPNDHDEGIVFGLPPTQDDYPMMRAWNENPDHQYDYRDLEQYLGRDAQLFVSSSCARFEAVSPDRSSDVYAEYVAVYRY